MKPFNSQMKDGKFIFNTNPGLDEVELINKFYQNCTYSVKKPEKKSTSLSVQHASRDPDPDGDGDGGQGGRGPPASASGLSSQQNPQQSKPSSLSNLQQLKTYFGTTKTLQKYQHFIWFGF